MSSSRADRSPGVPGAQRLRVLFFGTFDVRTHPRVQVLIEGFRAAGDDVVLCNVPLGLDTAWRVRILRRPWLLPVLLARLASAWTRLAGRSWRLRRRGWRPDAVVVGYLGHFDVHLARRLWPRAPLLLDHLVSARDTARDRGLGGRLDVLLARLDEAAVRTADVPFVDTQEHLSLLPDDVRARAAVVAVGAPQAWYAPPQPRAEGPLRAVFFGLYTPLQGAPVIGEALARLAGTGAEVAATMIGRGQDLDETRRRAAGVPGVTWREWVPAEELPALVAAHDVCLGIFGTGPKAGRVVPNKVFQGAAAGCAIVTADTPPQRAALAAAACFVPPGDAAALAAALAGLAGNREHVEELRRAAFARAQDFRPAAVVAPLRSRLATAGTSTRGSGPVSPPEPDAQRTSPRSRRAAQAAGRAATLPGVPADLPPLTLMAWLRHDLIWAHLERLPATAAVLEIGAGQGAMGARIARRFARYVAVETDPVSAGVAGRRVTPLGGTVVVDDLAALPPEERFDAVVAFEVLEHIADDAAALQAWRERLVPGGLLLLSVPAWQHRFAVTDTLVGHHRRYDPAVLAALLADAGFDDIRLQLYGFPLGYALETARNVVARRRPVPATPGHGSATSGRFLQPGDHLAGATDLLTRPFRALQRRLPTTRLGTGIVAAATRAE